MPLRPLLVFGTRPEAIKMARVVNACQSHPDIEPIICMTGQHRELLRAVNTYFGMIPDIDLDLMQEDQTLAQLTSRCLERLDKVFTEEQPDCAIAQGDTTSVMVTSLTSFYHQIPFVHIEAGLRTGNIYAPWPEEANRRIVSLMTTLHCAPTQRSAKNLLSEGVAPHAVHVTGNPVIDSLMWTLQRERLNSVSWEQKHAYLEGKRSVLITVIAERA